MKSIFVTQHGGAETLEMRDVPVPDPGSGQALIKVMAAGVNYADIMQRRGLYPGGPKPPYAAGFEVAGVIEKTGPDVTSCCAGDAVMGFCSGGYSEYAIADAASLLSKPESLDFVQAAAIPCQYLTAYHTLLTLGRLRKSQSVLIQAAAGGLGTFLVQIAHNVGATVFGTCSSEEKCELLRELGCDHPINYAEGSFYQEVARATGGDGCDLVIESVGGDVFDKSLRCVKPRGHMVVLGAASGKPRSLQTMSLLFGNITVSGFHLFGYARDVEAMTRAVDDLHAWIAKGILRIVVGHVFALEQAAAAHEFIESRKSSGKVVLKVRE